MTEKQREDILAYALFFSIIAHYVFGYGFWRNFANINIFYVTLYFCMDMWSLVVYMVCKKSKLLRVVSALGMGFGSYFFYMEFNSPEYWQVRDILTLLMILCNIIFIMLFTDKIKEK